MIIKDIKLSSEDVAFVSVLKWGRYIIIEIYYRQIAIVFQVNRSILRVNSKNVMYKIVLLIALFLKQFQYISAVSKAFLIQRK